MGDSTDNRFEDPRCALKRHGLAPKHSWGQNFLISQKAVSAIAEACFLPRPSLIVEIGPGVGTLTSALLRGDAFVTAVERDRDMCRVLRDEFKERDNFELIEGDAAEWDYRALLGEQKGVLVGNLPYQITGRLLRAAVESCDRLLRAVFMVQEEVAERLTALPKTSSRGALSVIVQARFNVKIALRLKPTAFYPPPKVRSAVMTFDPLPRAAFPPNVEPSLFDAVVNGAFSSRRKTVRNSLALSPLKFSTSMVESLLKKADVDASLRPEALSVQDFVRLAQAVCEAGPSCKLQNH